MKPMSYKQFMDLAAFRIRNKRKRIGVSILEAEDIIFGKKNSIAVLERSETPNACRMEYINYIYDLVLEEADRTGKPAIDIFRELEEPVSGTQKQTSK